MGIGTFQRPWVADGMGRTVASPRCQVTDCNQVAADPIASGSFVHQSQRTLFNWARKAEVSEIAAAQLGIRRRHAASATPAQSREPEQENQA